ncbi:MAG: hypothetical protein GEU90_19885 [Gemmatimonas sp.]|nr:hypothetical protein [Gemmatimonas sp.]
MELFSERSIWTMVHGILLGGGALLGLVAAIFHLYVTRIPPAVDGRSSNPSRAMARLTALVAGLLWLTVIVGMYVIFPPYRATPPEGATSLGQYPRALILSSPETAWLHAFAMETKEHVPVIAGILAAAVAFVAARYGSRLFESLQLRRMTMTLLVICFVLVAWVSLLGMFINKIAPLQ